MSSALKLCSSNGREVCRSASALQLAVNRSWAKVRRRAGIVTQAVFAHRGRRIGRENPRDFVEIEEIEQVRLNCIPRSQGCSPQEPILHESNDRGVIHRNVGYIVPATEGRD